MELRNVVWVNEGRLTMRKLRLMPNDISFIVIMTITRSYMTTSPADMYIDLFTKLKTAFASS